MPSALETLVKILKLEQSTGYQDKAVIGGLRAFAENWVNDAHAQARRPEHHTLVNELASLLSAYGGMANMDSRHDSIKYMLGRITGRIVPASTSMADSAQPAPDKVVTANPPTSSTSYPKRESHAKREPRPAPRDKHADKLASRPPSKNVDVVADTDGDEVGDLLSAEVTKPAASSTSSRHHKHVYSTRQSEAEHSQPPAAELASRTKVEDGHYLPTGFERPLEVEPAASEFVPTRAITPREPLRPVRRPLSERDERRIEETRHALRTTVTILDGVGPKMAEKLATVDIYTVGDVLLNFPRRYDDYTQMLPLAKLQPNMTVTVAGEVRNSTIIKGKRGQNILTVVIGDGTGTLTASFYGAGVFLRSRFERGMQVVFSGKVDLYLGRLSMSHPEWEPVERDALNTRSIVPIYSLTQDVSNHMLRRISKSAAERWTQHYPDPLPDAVLERLDLPELGWSIRQLHFPDSFEALKLAQRRVAFDELLLLQLSVLQNRRVWQSVPGLPLELTDELLEAFVASLPYPLTNAQTRALQTIRADLAKPIPMNRLLQGDVGAGKTVVAATAMAICIGAGAQAAIMAPTSILAEQHYKSLSQLIKNCPWADGVNIKLLTSATPAQERHDTLWGLGEGTVHIVVGTHALIQDDVNFWNLGLAIVDEQHRFGVEQRGKLRGKGTNPHLLVMTATPIPRTLALTMYADLDLSILDEMPPGRSPIDTRVIEPVARERAYGYIRAQLDKGRQAFIVYPLVEASDRESMAEVKSAVEEYERLSRDAFAHYTVALLHGRLSAAEKDAVMTAFSRNEVQVLVSTSVVEVGIDVPNATVILIEGANRFGLAQLHQFRGRVGRGQYASTCLLIPDNGDIVNPRLKAMEDTTDGFKLAEMDWQMRGAGDLLGLRQSGGAAILGEGMDAFTVQEAQLEARTIYEEDPALDLPHHAALQALIRQRIEASQSDVS